MKKQGKTKKKNDLPVFRSDVDFLTAFLEDESGNGEKTKKRFSSRELKKNKHGLPFIEDYESEFLPKEDQDAEGQTKSASTQEMRPEDLNDEEFARLLDESLKTKKTSRHVPKPMPLKRRLKRYPRPETDLDLHGFTAIGAQIKARSFIAAAKRQKYFTLRIIVGRGLHSEEGPVLPHVIEDLLKELKKDNIVLSYQWESRKQGKSGAVIVYLKHFND